MKTKQKTNKELFFEMLEEKIVNSKIFPVPRRNNIFSLISLVDGSLGPEDKVDDGKSSLCYCVALRLLAWIELSDSSDLPLIEKVKKETITWKEFFFNIIGEKINWPEIISKSPDSGRSKENKMSGTLFDHQNPFEHHVGYFIRESLKTIMFTSGGNYYYNFYYKDNVNLIEDIAHLCEDCKKGSDQGKVLVFAKALVGTNYSKKLRDVNESDFPFYYDYSFYGTKIGYRLVRPRYSDVVHIKEDKHKIECKRSIIEYSSKYIEKSNWKDKDLKKFNKIFSEKYSDSRIEKKDKRIILEYTAEALYAEAKCSAEQKLIVLEAMRRNLGLSIPEPNVPSYGFDHSEIINVLEEIKNNGYFTEKLLSKCISVDSMEKRKELFMGYIRKSSLKKYIYSYRNFVEAVACWRGQGTVELEVYDENSFLALRPDAPYFWNKSVLSWLKNRRKGEKNFEDIDWRTLYFSNPIELLDDNLLVSEDNANKVYSLLDPIWKRNICAKKCFEGKIC